MAELPRSVRDALGRYRCVLKGATTPHFTSEREAACVFAETVDAWEKDQPGAVIDTSWRLAKAVVDAEWSSSAGAHGEYLACPWCEAMMWSEPIPHDEGCPVLVARALLGGRDGG